MEDQQLIEKAINLFFKNYSYLELVPDKDKSLVSVNKDENGYNVTLVILNDSDGKYLHEYRYSKRLFDQGYWSYSTLKHRGWSDNDIQTMIDPPDKLVKNPHYSSSPPMKLYRKYRIFQIESDPDFYNKLILNKLKK